MRKTILACALLATVGAAVAGGAVWRANSATPKARHAARRSMPPEMKAALLARINRMYDLRDQAIDAAEAGNVILAETKFREALGAYSGHCDVLMVYADWLLRWRRKPEALALYRQALIYDPNGRWVTGDSHDPFVMLPFAELCEGTPGCADAPRAHRQVAEGSHFLEQIKHSITPEDWQNRYQVRALAYFVLANDLPLRERPEAETRAAYNKALSTARGALWQAIRDHQAEALPSTAVRSGEERPR